MNNQIMTKFNKLQLLGYLSIFLMFGIATFYDMSMEKSDQTRLERRIEYIENDLTNQSFTKRQAEVIAGAINEEVINQNSKFYMNSFMRNFFTTMLAISLFSLAAAMLKKDEYDK